MFLLKKIDMKLNGLGKYMAILEAVSIEHATVYCSLCCHSNTVACSLCRHSAMCTVSLLPYSIISAVQMCMLQTNCMSPLTLIRPQHFPLMCGLQQGERGSGIQLIRAVHLSCEYHWSPNTIISPPMPSLVPLHNHGPPPLLVPPTPSLVPQHHHWSPNTIIGPPTPPLLVPPTPSLVPQHHH